ncbi:MAG TPA: hypothetical protein DG942_00655 [Ruminococcaceae bacterium]|mgnify:CR=1 FL=1|jgi:hypothetical protein|nr:hypothetical protein [Oscillospiraceae bacterium]
MNAHITGSDLKDAQGKAITLADGKTYHLVFDMNAMCAMEDRYGSLESAMDALTGIGTEGKGPDGKPKPKKIMKDIRFMLWTALQHDNDELTEHQAAKLITFANMNQVMDALGEAMQASVPEADEKNVKNPQET